MEVVLEDNVDQLFRKPLNTIPQPASENQQSCSQPPPAKKLATTANHPSSVKPPIFLVKDLDLKKVLEESDEGQAILSHYEMQGKLAQKFSTLLCQIIMRHCFQGNPHTQLFKAQFEDITSLIVSLFPNESADLYYIPPEHIGGKKYCATGRLVDKYNARKRMFRETGLLLNSKKKGSVPSIDLLGMLFSFSNLR